MVKPLLSLLLAVLAGCTGAAISSISGPSEIIVPVKDSILNCLITAVKNQTRKKVTYDGSYFKIPYPGGDIPDSLGVCTDVIIRAYRKIGYDLQKLIHEDILRAKSIYSKRRNIEVIDASIDHRRCPNMETFFTRHGKKLEVSNRPTDYLPGDIVFWDVAAGHVGLVVNTKSAGDTARYLVVHNIGSGPKLEDFLFRATITGHYRYQPWKNK